MELSVQHAHGKGCPEGDAQDRRPMLPEVEPRHEPSRGRHLQLVQGHNDELQGRTNQTTESQRAAQQQRHRTFGTHACVGLCFFPANHATVDIGCIFAREHFSNIVTDELPSACTTLPSGEYLAKLFGRVF